MIHRKMLVERENLGEIMISDCFGDEFIEFAAIYSICEKKGVKINREELDLKVVKLKEMYK